MTTNEKPDGWRPFSEWIEPLAPNRYDLRLKSGYILERCVPARKTRRFYTAFAGDFIDYNRVEDFRLVEVVPLDEGGGDE